MYANKGMIGDFVSEIGHVGQLVKQAAGEAAGKVRHLLGAPVTTQAPPDPALLKTREQQSARIQLRLLAREERFEEILEVAVSALDEDLAGLAVIEIAQGVVGDVYRVKLLTQIARSFSHAAVPAAVVLANQNDVNLSFTIFLERLRNGDMETLVREGKAKLVAVLDFLGALDYAGETNYSSQHFDQLFAALSAEPRKQVEALLEILGDPDPTGPRGMCSPSSIAQDVKLRAMKLLQFVPVEMKDRALCFASKDPDEVVARPAVVNVMHLWRSQNIHGRLPQGLEPFPLLDTNLLTHLCNISAAFEWRDGLAGNAVYQRYQYLAERVLEIDVNAEPVLHAQDSKELEIVEEEMKRIAEQRVKALQPLFNQLTQALGIPNAALTTSDDPDVYAAYLIGNGAIQINRSILFDDRPLSEDLMSTLLHELGHMEQDVLVIRMIADDLGLIFGRHAHLLVPLYERYASGIGYAPESMFLLAVLRLRNDVPLTASQRQRALRLHEAELQANINQGNLSAAKTRFTRLTQSRIDLDEDKYESELLLCLKNTSALASWFAKGHVPSVLLYELENCKQDLTKAVTPLSPKGLPRDVVACAQQLYKSGFSEQLRPIVRRLKHVLLQVLNEECYRLQLEMNRISKTGYHEAEAYTISDRVEVIVKALRKGW